MKLKTLKEISGVYTNGNGLIGSLHTNNGELRQSAIEDIKELSGIEGLSKEENKRFFDKHNTHYTTLNGTIEYIKWKFNITEEELK